MPTLRGSFAIRYFEILGNNHRNRTFIYVETVRRNIKKFEEEQDYEKAYKLMKLLDEFLDSICIG